MKGKIWMAMGCIVILILCYIVQKKVYYGGIYDNQKNNERIDDEKNPTWKELRDEDLDMEVVAENKEVRKKVAYLTFDDGPSFVTEQVLDILKEKEIKATFFLVGNEITQEREPILKRMVKEGHVMGIHTYSHKKNEIYCSTEAYIEDVEKTYKMIFECTGYRVSIYRFPWGSANGFIQSIRNEIMMEMEKRGFTHYDWNVSAEDSIGNPTKYSILHNVEKDVFKYSEPVILLHDAKVNKLTPKVLPDIIRKIEENGYEFDTLNHRSKPYQYRRLTHE